MAWLPADHGYEGDPADLIDAAALVASLARRPRWHQDAACRGRGLARWFPARGQSLDPARTICAGCTVQAECAAFAAEAGQLVAGVWAGTSAHDRQALHRTG